MSAWVQMALFNNLQTPTKVFLLDFFIQMSHDHDSNPAEQMLHLIPQLKDICSGHWRLG